MTPRPLPASESAITALGAGRWALTGLLAAVSLAFGLVACGGGGSSATESLASPGVTATGFTQGVITGFGSIIVNGVRFDETSATITDDSDTALSASGLKLGMQVEVDHATVNASARTASAVAVRYGSLATGPVAAVNTSANTLTVLGQVVDISSSTVFSDALSAGLGAVTVGSVIEVHGQVDATTGHIAASRIEPITTTTAATRYKLRGTVAGLDTSAKTFSIGGAVISYAGLASTAVPSTLANGLSLRVLLATTQTAGQWVAQSLGAKAVRKVADHSTGHVRGKITAFTSSASFTVGNVVVAASAATFPDGSSGLALGVEVEVEGTVTNNVLVATSVGIESKHQAEPGHGLALIGAITAFDATAKTFVVRNVSVSYGDATTYLNGVVGDLAVGKTVSVTGTLGKQRHDSVQAGQITFTAATGT